jgi:DNA-binding response OmpR family regulator
MALTLVLSVGRDPELLGTRNLVLHSAGYIVVSAASIKEAVDRFADGDFDLVILCHSIPPRERKRLTFLIRASGSQTPIVSVSGDDCEYDEFADATLEVGPDTVLAGIEDVLLKRARRWSAPMTASCDKQAVAASLEKKLSTSNTGSEQRHRKTQTHERSFALLALPGGRAFPG